MAERPIAPVLKTGILTDSWVQIPVPPFSRSELARSRYSRDLNLHSRSMHGERSEE